MIAIDKNKAFLNYDGNVGIYDFEIMKNLIWNHIVLNESKLSFTDFEKELNKDVDVQARKSLIYNYLIQENHTKEELDKFYNDRLFKCYKGIMGEAIFENIVKGTPYKYRTVRPDVDYFYKIDCAIEDLTGEKFYFQVKTYEQKSKTFSKEKHTHNKSGEVVQYIYFNYDYNNRFFECNGHRLRISGYGRKKTQNNVEFIKYLCTHRYKDKKFKQQNDEEFIF